MSARLELDGFLPSCAFRNWNHTEAAYVKAASDLHRDLRHNLLPTGSLLLQIQPRRSLRTTFAECYARQSPWCADGDAQAGGRRLASTAPSPHGPER